MCVTFLISFNINGYFMIRMWPLLMDECVIIGLISSVK